MSKLGRSNPVSKGTGEVRIIGGVWKRTKLPVLSAVGLRPTPNRIRETLFNWLGQDLSGWRCLDVFAGTGALGFEAASRGAAEVILVEKSAVVAQHLRKVQQKLQANQIQIICTDAYDVLKQMKGQALDLIFIDPPFGLDVFDEMLSLAMQAIAPTGAVYLEANREVGSPQGATLYRKGRAGSVYYYLWVYDTVDAAIESSFDD